MTALLKTNIKKYKVDAIWHFTDRSNVDLIKEHSGILSLRELERRNIAIPVPGGNNWSHDADKNKGLDKYVHLTFLSNHPMLFVAKRENRIKEAIWLKIDISVLFSPEVRFSTDVSNKSGVEIIDHNQAATDIDFEVLFTHTNWSDSEIYARRQQAEKSEILVPDIVPTDRILGWKNG